MTQIHLDPMVANPYYTGPATTTTHTLNAIIDELGVYFPSEYSPETGDRLALPAVWTCTDGSKLTLTCAGRTETLHLSCDAGQHGPVLRGRGGSFDPTLRTEIFALLTTVLPMQEISHHDAFGLNIAARRLGLKVFSSSAQFDLEPDRPDKADTDVELLRLEHPDGRVVWGYAMASDAPNDAVALDDVVVLGGTVAGRYQLTLMGEKQHRILKGASFSTLPDGSFYDAGTPVTTEQLGSILQQLQAGTSGHETPS